MELRGYLGFDPHGTTTGLIVYADAGRWSLPYLIGRSLTEPPTAPAPLELRQAGRQTDTDRSGNDEPPRPLALGDKASSPLPSSSTWGSGVSPNHSALTLQW